MCGLCVAAGLSYPADAQNAQPLDQRFLLGVGTHQGLGGVTSARGYVPATAIKQMKELGVTSFRDDFPWSDFELPGKRLGFNALNGRLETQIRSGVGSHSTGTRDCQNFCVRAMG